MTRSIEPGMLAGSSKFIWQIPFSLAEATPRILPFLVNEATDSLLFVWMTNSELPRMITLLCETSRG